jgi:hypothetical protein
MIDDTETVHKLVSSSALARFRICASEGEEHPDRSWHRATCHVHRDDVPWAAVPLIYTVSAQSFMDARPRGASEIDFFARDEWRFADLLSRLRLERGALVFDADYVRGRMMKTMIVVEPTGKLVVETRNRHEMALRWLNAIKGKKHLRLLEHPETPGESEEERPES